MKELVKRTDIEDRIKQTLTSKVVPTYDWMYELGLNGTRLGIYAYIFNIIKAEPLKAHKITAQEIADVFKLTPTAVSISIAELCRRKLLFKTMNDRREGCYYSIYPLNENEL